MSIEALPARARATELLRRIHAGERAAAEGQGAAEARGLARAWCELARLRLLLDDDPPAALAACAAALGALPPLDPRAPGDPREPEPLRLAAQVDRAQARALGHDPEGALADESKALVELARLRRHLPPPARSEALARLERTRAQALLLVREPLFALEAATTAQQLLDEAGQGGAPIDLALRGELALLEARALRELGELGEAERIADELAGAFAGELPDELLLVVVEVARLRGQLRAAAGEPAAALARFAEAAALLEQGGQDFPGRWAALEQARARVLARQRPEEARLAFAAARQRLEPALKAGRSDLLVPLFLLCRAELRALSADEPAVAVRLGRAIHLARLALGDGAPVTPHARRAWKLLRAAPAAQRALASAPAESREALAQLERALGQRLPHPLGAEDS